jgi:hypothetical protein
MGANYTLHLFESSPHQSMNPLILLILLVLGVYALNVRDQRRRVALLGGYLSQYQIEKLMANLTQGYLRALGEANPERQAQIWNLLTTSESDLSEQFSQFVAEFAKVDEKDACVSKLPIGLPYADKIFPSATFDLRKLMSIHARGLSNAASNIDSLTPKRKAFTLSAELFLMQHSCHWFCRSKALASARLLAGHKTSYAQVLDSVAPDTRQAYSALIGV